MENTGRDNNFPSSGILHSQGEASTDAGKRNSNDLSNENPCITRSVLIQLTRDGQGFLENRIEWWNDNYGERDLYEGPVLPGSHVGHRIRR